MLRKIRALFAGKPQQRRQADIAAALDFSEKPIAEAIAVRGASLVDESAADLKAWGIPSGTNQDPSMQESMEVWVITITNKLVMDAMPEAGIKLFFPGEPVPKRAQIVVAFSCYIVAILHLQLRGEGIVLNHERPALMAAGNLFTAHPMDEKIAEVQRGIALWKRMTKAKTPDAEKFLEDLTKLVQMYVLSATRMKKFSNQAFPRLFGQMLSSMIAASANMQDSILEAEK